MAIEDAAQVLIQFINMSPFILFTQKHVRPCKVKVQPVSFGNKTGGKPGCHKQDNSFAPGSEERCHLSNSHSTLPHCPPFMKQASK